MQDSKPTWKKKKSENQKSPLTDKTKIVRLDKIKIQMSVGACRMEITQSEA